MSLSGKWNYKYYYNNNEADTGHFYLGLTARLIEKSKEQINYKRLSSSKIEQILPKDYKGKLVVVYSVSGQLISKQIIENNANFIIELPTKSNSQLFILRIAHSEGENVLKIIN